MQTLIDISWCGPNHASRGLAVELPAPAIERYRAAAPRMSIDLEVTYDDPDANDEPSDRFLRARCWVSED